MSLEEYFGEWLKVIPYKEMQIILSKLKPIKDRICPEYKDVFKAFHCCPYNSLRLVILGQDPYPQKGVATGLAFANKSDTKALSPSLQVIKESVINYEIPHNIITFADDLEEWAKQGVLLLNTALTCLIDKPGFHSLLWRPFISKLLTNICDYNTGLVFLLMGNSAKSLSPYINRNQHIIETAHPSYYYRKGIQLPHEVWTKINDILYSLNGEYINFYKELNV